MYGVDEGIMSLGQGPLSMADGGIASLPGLQDRFGRPWTPGSPEVPYQVGAGVLGAPGRGSFSWGNRAYRAPEVVPPTIPPPVVPAPEIAPPGSDRQDGPTGPNDNPLDAPGGWGSLTPEQQAGFYGENPNFGKATQTLQNLFGYTTLGMVQNAMNPGFVQQQQNIAKGISPTPLSQSPTTEGVPQNMTQAVAAQAYGDAINAGATETDASVMAAMAANLVSSGMDPAQATAIATGGMQPGGGSPFGGDVISTPAGPAAPAAPADTGLQGKSMVDIGGGGITDSAVAAAQAAAAAAGPGIAGLGMDVGPADVGADQAAAAADALDAALGAAALGGIDASAVDTGVGTSSGGGAESGSSAAMDAAGGSADLGGGDGGGGGGDGGCFITTATVRHLGEADDGPTLTALRAFRDRYMAATPERREQVRAYYTHAPRIVALLNARQDAAEIYRAMWKRFIEPAACAARRGQDGQAYALYVDGMKWAQERAVV